jgi:HSP20 family molecular chaperone IbpA
MPYFACPMGPQYQQRQQPMNALDPFLQAIFAQLQEPEEPQQQSQQSAAAASKKQPVTMHGAAAAAAPSRPKPTPKNLNRSNTAFSPRFDVFETADVYHLEGDLPGVGDKKSISIEFSDERTLLIRGRVERTVSKPTPQPVNQIEGEGEASKEEKENRRRSLQPTVEDTEDEDDFSVVSASSSSSSAKKAENKDNKRQEQPHDEEPPRKVWLSERNYGDFQRTFSFPSPVDTESVSAKLENGLLTVVVPKAVFGSVRKIEID